MERVFVVVVPKNLGELMSNPDYSFIKTDTRLSGLAYVTVGGSRAYGTAVDTSDLDIRGFVVESVPSLLLGSPIESYESTVTDTTLYGLRKLVSLLKSCNPSVVEMFGTKPEHVLFCNRFGELIRRNLNLFLSKKAFVAFAGYATQQLRRLENALCHDSYPNEDKQKHIKGSLDSLILSMRSLEGQYSLAENSLVFDVVGVGEDAEVVVSVNVEKMSLTEFKDVSGAVNNMVKNYNKLNHRNRKKDEAHLKKHAMHLVRLYLEGIEILRGEGVHTYRENDLELLRGIRAGDVSIDDVFKMVPDYEKKMKSAFESSPLPDKPDNDKIDNLLLDIYAQDIGVESFSRLDYKQWL